MNRQEIQHIVRLLPKDSPYFRHVPAVSPTEPRALAVCDPAFGWHLAQSYAGPVLK